MKVTRRLATHRNRNSFSLSQLRLRLRILCGCVVLTWGAGATTCVALWLSYRLGRLPTVFNFIPLLQVVFVHFLFSRLWRQYRQRLAEDLPHPATQLNLWAWAHLLFSPPTVEKVFLPLLSDIEVEQEELLKQRGPRAARSMKRQSYWVFWKAVGSQLASALWRRVTTLGRPQLR